MNSGRGSTPVGEAAAEKSTANTFSPEGSDSGYASIENTTDGFNHSQDFADGVAVPSRTFFERKVTKLKLFDQEIPQLIQHRFHDLHELFERPLCDYLIKAKVNPNPISIKLKVLGENEAIAKPWIVVLCNKTASKKIRHFFNQQHIKAQYQPSDSDSLLPSFEVFVCKRPPRPMAGTEIYGDSNERATVCGRIIKVGEDHHFRFATLGGVIKVVKPTGNVMLYGMTAGHVLAQQPLGQESFDSFDICDDEDEEDEGFYSGEEEYELDDSFEGDEEVQDLATTGGRSRTDSQSTQLGRLWPRIGYASATSNEGTRMGHDLDWALIEFDRPADYRPNILVYSDREDQAARNRPLMENGKFTEDGSSRSVFLLSGTGGVKSGMLSTSLSFLMMGSAKAFTKTYTLVLPHGSVLNAGDCGSWVVDPSTCEVYGHVVASDAMGDTYVVPLSATFRDMEEKLEAAVSLPTEADIKTWLAQHAKAAAEEVTFPARSKKKKVAFNDCKPDRAEIPKDVTKLTGKSSSQASASSPLSDTKRSTAIVDYCNSCDARFEGTSQHVRSNLLRHLQTCPRHKKGAANGLEESLSQDAKDILDVRSKESSRKYSKDVQQKATDSASTQQTGPVPWSIRSMYSSFKKRSSNDSQQKDADNGKSIGNLHDNKAAGIAFSKKPAAAALKPSIAHDRRNTTKTSDPNKDLASPPISKGLPAPSSAPAARMRKDLEPDPQTTPAIPDHRLSLPINNPLSPRLRQSVGFVATPPPRPTPPLDHGHESFFRSNLGPRQPIQNSSPGQVSYEGYTFTKFDSKRRALDEKWAVARMTPMPVSQEDLKDQIRRNRKKHKSATDEYNDDKMKGFKRKQVDNLIRERTKIDGDYGYEYVLASIKLDSRKSKKNITETVSMQVILKRQRIAGVPLEPSTGPSLDFHAKMPSQVMDLISGDEPRWVRDYGGGSHDVVGREGADVSFAGHPGAGAFPMPPAHSQSFGHGVQRVDNRLPLFDVIPRPPSFHVPLDNVNSPGHGIIQSPIYHSVPLVQQEIHNTQGQIEITDNTKQKKKKKPKIIHVKHETRKKRDYLSNSPSLSDLSIELNSDNSWTKTDATPDTVISGQSREYRKEKKSDKASKERSYDKDSVERMPYAHETERPAYRHHRREEHRHSSLSPARRPSDVSSSWIDSRRDLDLGVERGYGRVIPPQYSYRPRYRYHGDHEVEPAMSFHTPRFSRPRQSSASPERLPHRRTSSYDRDRLLAHDSRAFVPRLHCPSNVYREPTRDSSRAVDVIDHRAELPREHERWEREGLRIERDEAEARARSVREMEMEMEMERERRGRKERDAGMVREIAMGRDARRKSMTEMERRGSVIIERRGSRRGTTYDDRYMPRHRRDPGYYY